MPRLQTYSVPGRAEAFVDSAESRNIPFTRILALNRSYEDSLIVIQELDLPTLSNIDGLFCAIGFMGLGALD